MIVLASASTATSTTCRPPARALAVVARAGRRSVVERAFAASPLRLLTPLNHGHGAWIFTSTYGGGLIGGDALGLDLRVGTGATAALLTQASTKVYRSTRGASMDVDAAVEDGGLLAMLPDPVVPFAASSYEQRQTFWLAGSGSLVAVDWVTAGRRDAGERWRFDRYASRLTLRRDGRLVLVDATTLDAGEAEIAPRMGRFDTLCTVVLAGAQVEAPAAAAVARLAREPLAARADLIVSASPLAGGGCLLRLAGRSVEAVGRAVREQLAFLPDLLGDNPWLRKW